MFIFINSDKIMNMIKFKLSYGFFALSIGLFLLFSLSPSTLDDQGFLQEPFYLILLGYGSLFIGLVTLIVEWIKKQ
ncbi:MAG: DUF3955 domain-containing protein [Bacilli bacterium]